MMGDPPAAQACSRPRWACRPSFGRIDIDQQLDTFRERARSDLRDREVRRASRSPETREKLIRLFLIRDQAQQSTFATGANVALTLLLVDGAAAPRLGPSGASLAAASGCTARWRRTVKLAVALDSPLRARNASSGSRTAMAASMPGSDPAV